MRTKAILFDKDGTLLDFDAFWISLAKTALGTLFAENDISFPEEEIMAMVGVKEGKTDINGVLVHGTYGDIAELLYPLMKEKGYEHLFTINANTLQATVKEMISENEGKLPEWLDGLINTYEKQTIRVKKN